MMAKILHKLWECDGQHTIEIMEMWRPTYCGNYRHAQRVTEIMEARWAAGTNFV